MIAKYTKAYCVLVDDRESELRHHNDNLTCGHTLVFVLPLRRTEVIVHVVNLSLSSTPEATPVSTF